MRAVLIALASILAAQQPASLPPLAERIEVTVVNVDVTVLDAAGNPVTGLNAKDFEIREDGTLQAITNFDVVDRGASKKVDFESDPDQRRSFVVLMDNHSFVDKPRRSKAASEIEHLVATSPEDSQWSIVTLRNGRYGVQTALPMTSDRAQIHAALDALSRGAAVPATTTNAPVEKIHLDPDRRFDCPAGGCMATSFRNGVAAAQEMDSSGSFFDAVTATARGMSWIPGKKAMLIISSAVPGYAIASPGLVSIEEALLHERMVREANAANVSLFIIDPTGPTPRLTSGAYWLATLTGGEFMPSNRIDQSVAKFDTATSHFYSLGYQSHAADGKFHRISVALKKPGRYTLMYRQNYLKLSHEQEFERSLATPFGITALKATLPLTLSVDDPQPAAPGEAIVPIRITVPMTSTLFIGRGNGEVGRLHIYVSVFGDGGQTIAFHHYAETITNADAARQSDLIVSRAIRLTKGTYRIFVTIRDELSDDVGVVAKEVRL